MSRIRVLNAGLAGSTNVNSNVNGNQGGGSKKQGLPGISNMRSSLVYSINQRAYGTPQSRDKIFYINQLSGIGPKSRMFSSRADGVFTGKKPVSLIFNKPFNLKVLDTYYTDSSIYGENTRTQRGFTLSSELTNDSLPLNTSDTLIKSTSGLATSLRFLSKSDITDSQTQITFNSNVYIATGDRSDTTNPLIIYAQEGVNGLFLDTLDNIKTAEDNSVSLDYVWRIGSKLSQNTETDSWDPLYAVNTNVFYNNDIMLYSSGAGGDAHNHFYYETSNCGWYGCRTLRLNNDGSLSLGHGNAKSGSGSSINTPDFVSFKVLE
jgi:hypothetical protein